MLIFPFFLSSWSTAPGLLLAAPGLLLAGRARIFACCVLVVIICLLSTYCYLDVCPSSTLLPVVSPPLISCLHVFQFLLMHIWCKCFPVWWAWCHIVINHQCSLCETFYWSTNRVVYCISYLCGGVIISIVLSCYDPILY